jgi:hypothetical protein
MVSRHTANLIALAIFVILLITGINLIITVGPTFDAPKTTTTVLEVGKGEGSGKRTRSFEKEGRSEKKTGKRTYTAETPTAGGSSKRTTTVEEGSRSFLERSLGKSGLIGLQVAVVLFASFLAAALTQRALVGDFTVKVGSVLELSALQEAAANPVTDLAANVTTLEATVREGRSHQETLSRLVAGNTADVKATLHAVAELENRVGILENAVADGPPPALGGGEA